MKLLVFSDFFSSDRTMNEADVRDAFRAFVQLAIERPSWGFEALDQQGRPAFLDCQFPAVLDDGIDLLHVVPMDRVIARRQRRHLRTAVLSAAALLLASVLVGALIMMVTRSPQEKPRAGRGRGRGRGRGGIAYGST